VISESRRSDEIYKTFADACQIFLVFQQKLRARGRLAVRSVVAGTTRSATEWTRRQIQNAMRRVSAMQLDFALPLTVHPQAFCFPFNQHDPSCSGRNGRYTPNTAAEPLASFTVGRRATSVKPTSKEINSTRSDRRGEFASKHISSHMDRYNTVYLLR
jgi:hypothetical protein